MNDVSPKGGQWPVVG